MSTESPNPLPSSRPSVLLLGIDAGGSHTTALVADPGVRVLARAEGPGAAMRPGGAAHSAAIIGDTARRAARQAGVALPAKLAVVGAAGAGRELEQSELARALEQAGIAAVADVRPDGEIALYAAFEATPGVLINAGTGSIAFARSPAGQLLRSGGWGWQMGDEGAGYWMGRRALVEAGRAADGRAQGSTLETRLLTALALQSFDDLVRWAATSTPAQVAALAPHVLNAAREGETVAKEMVAEAARALVELARPLLAHFPGSGAIPVALTGGLLLPDSLLARALTEILRREVPRANLRPGPVDGALGAAKMAAELVR